jgi:hypothetical protein
MAVGSISPVWRGTLDITMSDIDELVARAVNGVTTIAGRAAAFSTRILLWTIVVCVGGFLLGIAALSGGIQTVWIVLGIVFGAIAIGSAFVARWRIGAVKRHVPDLADEMRALLDRDREAGQVVIDTFVVDGRTEANPGAGSSLVVGRHMYGVRGDVGTGLEGTPYLSAAIRAVTGFPLRMLGAVLISLVFGFLGVIFLIALAL